MRKGTKQRRMIQLVIYEKARRDKRNYNPFVCQRSISQSTDEARPFRTRTRLNQELKAEKSLAAWSEATVILLWVLVA